MEIQGKLVSLLEEVTGESSKGKWRKKEFVIETEGQYPKNICFSLWGDKIDALPTKAGTPINVSFDIESREFKGKWYTEARAWKVDISGNNPNPSKESGLETSSSIPSLNQDSGINSSDDLPF